MILEALTATILAFPTTAHAGAAAIPDRWQPFAACVSNRESHGNYRAANATGHQGRWQFNDRAWRHGLAHMVAIRLIHFGVSPRQARKTRTELRRVRIQMWPGWAQDAGFIAAVTAPNGWEHWRLAGSRCNHLHR